MLTIAKTAKILAFGPNLVELRNPSKRRLYSLLTSKLRKIFHEMEYSLKWGCIFLVQAFSEDEVGLGLWYIEF